MANERETNGSYIDYFCFCFLCSFYLYSGGMDESWYRFQTLEFAKSLQSSDWDSEYDVFSTVTKIRYEK